MNCPKCGVTMRPGQAIEQTWRGGVDYEPGALCNTMIAGGPGKLIPCLKCPGCGHSATDGEVVGETK